MVCDAPWKYCNLHFWVSFCSDSSSPVSMCRFSAVCSSDTVDGGVIFPPLPQPHVCFLHRTQGKFLSTLSWRILLDVGATWPILMGHDKCPHRFLLHFHRRACMLCHRWITFRATIWGSFLKNCFHQTRILNRNVLRYSFQRSAGHRALWNDMQQKRLAGTRLYSDGAQ